MKNTSKEYTVILYDTSDINSSSVSEADNSPDKYEKTSIAYDSESADNDESSGISVGSEDNIWLGGCRDSFIIDKLKPNSKSKIKEHKISANNLDKALHDAHILNTLQNTPNKNYKQIKSNRKLKHVHCSPIIFVKLVITASKKYRQSKIRLVKSLVDSRSSESILTKDIAEKLPVKKTKQER